MSNEELLGELSNLFTLSVQVIARAGQIYAEVRKRGIEFEIRSTVFRELIPRIADGSLTPEAVSAFADAPDLLKLAGKCDVETQRRLASGGSFPVVKRAGGQPVMMTIRDMERERLLKTVIVAGKVLAPAEQDLQLRAKSKRFTHSNAAAPRRHALIDEPDDGESTDLTAAPLKAAVASEREAESLIEKIDAEIRRRGGRPTTREMIEMVQMFGWGPIR